MFRLSFLDQGGALRAPVAGPFLILCRARRACGLAPGPAARQRRRRAVFPEGTANGREPSPGGQVSGYGRVGVRRRAGRWRRPGCHPDDLPKGYQLAPGGQAWQRPVTRSSKVAPRERADRATPGRRDGTAGAVSRVGSKPGEHATTQGVRRPSARSFMGHPRPTTRRPAVTILV